MKPMLLVALLAAVASSTMTALLFSVNHSSEARTSNLTPTDIKDALREIEGELRSIRGELSRGDASARGAVPAVSEGDSAPAGGSEGRRMDTLTDTASGTASERLREPGLEMAPPANYQRLAELEGWQDDSKLRRSWIFRTEAEVLALFGTPDEIHLTGVEENWVFLCPTGSISPAGDPVYENIVLKLNRGRLIGVDD